MRGEDQQQLRKAHFRGFQLTGAAAEAPPSLVRERFGFTHFASSKGDPEQQPWFASSLRTSPEQPPAQVPGSAQDNRAADRDFEPQGCASHEPSPGDAA